MVVYQDWVRLENYRKNNQKEEYDQLKNEIAEYYMKLAEGVVKKKNIEELHIPFEDKMQIAYLGLIEAVERYKTSFKATFEEYASSFIQERILNEANKDGDVKQSTILERQTTLISEFESQYYMQHGKNPTSQKIAETLGITVDRVDELKMIMEKVDHKDIRAEGVVDFGLVEDLKESLNRAFGNALTPREEKILCLRYGLDDGRPRTIQEIADEFKITRDKVSRTIKKACEKLRGNENLVDYSGR